MARPLTRQIQGNVIPLELSRKPQTEASPAVPRPTAAQRDWLSRGLTQPDGKLPLFDELGARINTRTIKSCMRQGWAEPWFDNPLKPDWLICKLTVAGREALQG